MDKTVVFTAQEVEFLLKVLSQCAVSPVQEEALSTFTVLTQLVGKLKG